MAFRIFKPKKYHLGMTGDEVKAALEGGGGGDRVILNLLESEDIGDQGGYYTEKTVDEILTISDNVAALKYVMGNGEVYYFPVISIYNEGLDCIGFDLNTFETPLTTVAVNSLEKRLFNDQYHYVLDLGETV